jgi:hypothetical protein
MSVETTLLGENSNQRERREQIFHPEVRVRTEGEAVLSSWLNLHRESLSNGSLGLLTRINVPTALSLGDVSFDDGIFSKAKAAISVDHHNEKYQLAFTFFPPTQDAAVLNGGIFRPRASLDTSLFLNNLAEKQFTQNYTPRFEVSSGSVFINYGAGHYAGEDPQPGFHFKALQTKSGLIYQLQLEQELSKANIAGFPKHFAALGEVSAHISNSLYRTYGFGTDEYPIPDRMFIIKPADSIEVNLKRLMSLLGNI